MDLVVLILTCIINLILGLIILMRDIRKSYAQLFAAISVLLCAWIVTNYVTNHHTSDLMVTNLANNLAFVTGYCVLLAGLLFTFVFPVRRKVRSVEATTLAILSFAAVGFSMTPLVAGVVTQSESGELIFSTGSLLWLFAIILLVVLVLTIRNLVSAIRREHGTKRQQARIILIAFGLTALVGIILNAVLPLLTGDWTSTRFGPLVTVILASMIAYAIIRHGLFDIRLAVVRGATYILSLVTLAAMYYLTAYAVSRVVFEGQSTYFDSSPLNIALALLLAFIFQPVKRFFDKLTNRIFYRDNYEIGDFFARLSQKLNVSNDLHGLLQHAAKEIHDTIKTESSFFFVRHGSYRVSVGEGRYSRPTLEELKSLDEYIAKHGPSIVLIETMEGAASLQRVLTRRKIALILPLLKDNQALGYLFLGQQRSHNFTQRDIRALETVSDELVIAIQNALSVQEVKEINDTLQQRIDDATKELRKTNEQLQKLDAAKDEFVSMASHQLRTPLTSIKGYISMVLEGDVGKITPTQRQMLSEAFTSSERMVHLIGDFLNVSRLQTGKFMLEDKPVDLSKLVSQEIDSLQTTIEAHGLKLHYRKPSYFPVLMLDEGKIRQVLMNFIDNAIFYSPEGKTITVKLSVEEGFAVVRVIDAGIGVPKSEQAHLFTKFFRASNARKQRPDGTGVGLFLAKKVIAAHGGTMLFESEEGKGSTFGFRMPIKKLQASEKDMKTSAGNGAYQLKK
jgi:signal transduction histidine kinase